VALLLPFRQQKLGGPVLRPTVDVLLDVDGLRPPWQADALIDSGAPYTVFDFATADVVGVQLGRAGADTARLRILGGDRDVQLETVQLTLVADPEYSWTAEVGFIKDRSFVMPFQGVLGTNGFLDKHAVTLNYYYNYFVLDRPDEVHGRLGSPKDVPEAGLNVPLYS
jgi:hypothetical protein